MMLVHAEDQHKGLSLVQDRDIVGRFFDGYDCAGKRILLIVPDNTRSGPVGEIFQMIFDCIARRVAALDVLFALGTHPPMTEQQMCKRLAVTDDERMRKYAAVRFFNHAWDRPQTFTVIGRIAESEIGELTDGLFREEVPVAVNKCIFDYDELFIIGPVFPHEVVGFSGGHKYIFPGIAGAEIIHFFHWLGAVITNPRINGEKLTATRKVVEKAASFISVPRKLFALVAVHNELKGLYVGDVLEAWDKAADLSRRVHIVYDDKAYHTVLGIAHEMYDDVWTAGKVMYKLEPVVADGGTLIIYAPHISEISYTHGRLLDEIGYHTRDYFLAQWDKFKHYPRGVLAHSTHVKGIGTYVNGVEKPRVNVVLATAIPPDRCRKVHLGYMNPADIRIGDYENRQSEGVLVVPHAGEMLHRLSSGEIPRIPDNR